MFLNSLAFTLLILFVNVFGTHGSHFDGGTISYEVVGTNGSKLIVRITQTYTYVYSKIYCNNTYIANQWDLVLSPYGDATATLNCTANCATDGGYTPIPVASKCTDFSVGMGITVGQRTDDIALANGSYFVISNQGSAFRTLNLPGSGGSSLDWSISTLIDLRIRSDGTYNTPPKATMISPVYIPAGIQQTISIPTIDADNDNVRCRYANGTNECGDVCPPSSLPTGTTISSDCILTITGKTAGDWYAVALQVEDFANSTTTTPFSSVPVQFLVYVYAQPACTQKPYLYGPSLDGTCTGVQVGVPYTLNLYAINYCSSYGVTMVDIATQSFPIVIKTPIVQNTSTLWSISLTWTPTATEVGPQVFCSVGIDSESVQTNQYCLTFTVGSGTLGNCPGVEITTIEVATTMELTTEALTTASSTTTVTVANTTAANTTSANTTPVTVIVIIIPICCCCCCGSWLLYCCLRLCRMFDVEERKNTVTTYTIEGANMYKDHSLIDKKYFTDDNVTINTASVTNRSSITSNDAIFNIEATSAKSFLSDTNDLNQSLPSIRQNTLIAPDAKSEIIDSYQMMMTHSGPRSRSSSIPKRARPIPNPMESSIPGVKTTDFDRYPPLQASTQIGTSRAPATITSNIYQENVQQPMEPLSLKSPYRPTTTTNLNFISNGKSTHYNTRPATSRPWTKHPRWVLRLAKPKEVHALPLSSDRPPSGDQLKNKSASSTNSTSTIPRYAFYEE